MWPIFLILLIVLAEQIPRFRREPIGLFDFGITGFIYLAASFLIGVMGVALVFLLRTHVNFFTGASHFPDSLQLVLCLGLMDLLIYIAHFYFHRIPFLWRMHRVHHEATQVNWLATFRSHFISQLLMRCLAPVFLLILGFRWNVVLLASSFFGVWAIFTHANLKFNFGWLELVLVTPAMHYFHHSAEGAHKNLGTVFSFWDRAFGRFYCRQSEGRKKYLLQMVSGPLES